MKRETPNCSTDSRWEKGKSEDFCGIAHPLVGSYNLGFARNDSRGEMEGVQCAEHSTPFGAKVVKDFLRRGRGLSGGSGFAQSSQSCQPCLSVGQRFRLRHTGELGDHTSVVSDHHLFPLLRQVDNPEQVQLYLLYRCRHTLIKSSPRRKSNEVIRSAAHQSDQVSRLCGRGRSRRKCRRWR